MQAGKLRKRITIQTPSTTQNAIGEPIASWADTITVWGSIEPLKIRERIAAAQVDTENMSRVTIRYPGFVVTSAMRLKYGTRYFSIQGASNLDERNRTVEIQCVEVGG